MKYSITKRGLTVNEIALLIAEMRDFPDIGMLRANLWREFSHVFILQENHTFAGVCVAIPLEQWVKIGPVIVLKRFQGKGYGRALLSFITNHYRTTNIYIGSSNRKVAHILGSLGYRTVSFFQLAKIIQRYLLIYIFKRIDRHFIIDAIKKLIFHKRDRYRYFIKPKN